ncbi:30S ribosomal protein S4 [bacterium]|nr:30S ribosomal protein S4 [bacterium]
MGRYTGPTTRLSRREGQNLFLKGTRSTSEKSAFVKKPQAPGMHGNSRTRLSDYGIQLREKQKLKRMYGLLEKQFKNYYKKATNTPGVTGENLISLLELRLDNIIYKLGIGSSRSQSRQLVRQNKVLVNGKILNIPSYQFKMGDILTLKEGFIPSIIEGFESPVWLNWDKKSNSAKLLALPKREDFTEEIKEQLIVEFYSR